MGIILILSAGLGSFYTYYWSGWDFAWSGLAFVKFKILILDFGSQKREEILLSFIGCKRRCGCGDSGE